MTPQNTNGNDIHETLEDLKEAIPFPKERFVGGFRNQGNHENAGNLPAKGIDEKL